MHIPLDLHVNLKVLSIAWKQEVKREYFVYKATSSVALLQIYCNTCNFDLNKCTYFSLH